MVDLTASIVQRKRDTTIAVSAVVFLKDLLNKLLYFSILVLSAKTINMIIVGTSGNSSTFEERCDVVFLP